MHLGEDLPQIKAVLLPGGSDSAEFERLNRVVGHQLHPDEAARLRAEKLWRDRLTFAGFVGVFAALVWKRRR